MKDTMCHSFCLFAQFLPIRIRDRLLNWPGKRGR
nr:MAG TPA_asm: hypothetical protein [Caudoviricetes sp.]